MEHFYQNLGENWFTYPSLYKQMVEYFPDGSHFVEVGTWKGMSASYMAVEIINSGKNIKFDCVDNWEYIEGLQNDIPKEAYDNLYEIFLKNISPIKHIINPVKALSKDGVKRYKDESLDFVFIDAAHDYENVKEDITLWYSKVKPMGIISGHDYSWGEEVRRAVHDFFDPLKLNIQEIEGCWVVVKEEK
jgi:predicted O-methyltransferase YrrM